eukprot:scaffold195123_cov31-Prasinocladus_malaysianus.AAC.1
MSRSVHRPSDRVVLSQAHHFQSLSANSPPSRPDEPLQKLREDPREIIRAAARQPGALLAVEKRPARPTAVAAAAAICRSLRFDINAA